MIKKLFSVTMLVGLFSHLALAQSEEIPTMSGGKLIKMTNPRNKAALGEVAYYDKEGKVAWGSPVRAVDGTILKKNFEQASRYCKERGATLPNFYNVRSLFTLLGGIVDYKFGGCSESNSRNCIFRPRQDQYSIYRPNSFQEVMPVECGRVAGDRKPEKFI